MTKKILTKVNKLITLYKEGKLGGEIMPEDSNPNLDKKSPPNLLYFTLPMALNYQRNSYTLWQAALATWEDKDTKEVFDPKAVIIMSQDQLKQKLLKYKLAIQPNKQPKIWQTLCQTISSDFEGDLINLFTLNNGDISQIKQYITSNKKKFPYLSGSKILNYWLYVISNYTSLNLTNHQAITIAPDTHILKASVKLNVITEDELTKSNIRDLTSARWNEILKGTTLLPIDLHTPFWLWSRNGFKIDL